MEVSAQEIKSDINITPLVDVVLVLLIIFMVVTPMIVSRDVELPVTSHPGAQPQQPQKIIYLTAAGALFFEEAPVITEILVSRLEELQQRSPHTRILLQADRRLNYQVVMETLDLISRSGYTEIGLIVQPATRQDEAEEVRK